MKISSKYDGGHALEPTPEPYKTVFGMDFDKVLLYEWCRSPLSTNLLGRIFRAWSYRVVKSRSLKVWARLINHHELYLKERISDDFKKNPEEYEFLPESIKEKLKE